MYACHTQRDSTDRLASSIIGHSVHRHKWQVSVLIHRLAVTCPHPPPLSLNVCATITCN